MNRHIPPATSHEKARLLSGVSSLATRAARRLVACGLESPDEVDDLAQRCVLDCLVRLRSGRWHVDPTLDALVASMVWRKSAWGRRGEQHRHEFEMQHVAERDACVPVWMEPDKVLDERDTQVLFRRALSELPARCRAVFTFIRDGRGSYRDAAARFEISVGLVVADMRRAERHLAARLLEKRTRPVTALNGQRTLDRQRRTRSTRQGMAAD